MIEPTATQEPTEEPTSAPTPTEEPTAGPVIHTVRAGENLYRIGLRYGVTWQVIMEANNIAEATDIYVGMELIIPVGG